MDHVAVTPSAEQRNDHTAYCELQRMVPRLRAAMADLTPSDVMVPLTYITLRMQRTTDNPDILCALRFAITAPEPGDSPHSLLVNILKTAAWTRDQTANACKQLADLAHMCPHPGVWTALAEELAAAGQIADRSSSPVPALPTAQP